MPDTSITTPSQIILVALDDLRDPDWNPRPFLDEAEMPSLVDYVAAGRPLPPIEILKPSAEASEDGPIQGPPWYVISGKRRCEAHRRAGKTHIEAIARDIPLEEAKFMAIAANQDDKPFWLGEFIAVKNLKKGDYGEQKLFARKLGWSEKRVSHAFNLMALFNPTCRDLIFQSTYQRITSRNSLDTENQGNSISETNWQLTEAVAVRLIPFWDEKDVEVSQAQAEKAVRTIIDHQLTGPQTDDLVAFALRGGDIAQFQPTAKVRKARKTAPPTNGHPLPPSNHRIDPGIRQHVASFQMPSHLPPELLDKVVELRPSFRPHPAAHAPSTPPPSPNGISQPPERNATAHAVGGANVGTNPSNSNWFWKSMLGISFFKQLRKKVNRCEPLTNTEKAFVLLRQIYQVLHQWVFQPFGHFLKEMVKDFFHSMKEALGKTVKKILDVVVPLLVIGALIWFAWKVYQYGFEYPVHWIENKIESVFHHGQSNANGNNNAPSVPSSPSSQPAASAQAPASPPVISSIISPVQKVVSRLVPEKKKEAPLSVSNPAPVYQPSIAFNTASPLHTTAQYDPNYFESEIQALPQNSIVKAFPLEPDETMPGDLADSRLQDLTDTDKYTMKTGRDAQKILSVSPSNTTLTVNYKSADALGSFLNSGGQMIFFWEDVKAIHTDEVDFGPDALHRHTLYQCSLIVSGSKNPLTIQCASADDLKHLVSTMEYFIRSSRLGYDTALAGMPYPSQGLRLTNDRVIEKIWADSPADKAGLQLGDHLWSVKKATADQEEKKVLETGLQSLPVTLFAASPVDWTKARIAQGPESNSFHPKLTKITLNL